MNKNDIKSHTKNHSFSKTPSLAQVTSWIIFTTQALVFYIYVINAYQSDNIRMTMITLFTISFAALVFFGIYTGQNDPTDELVIAFKNKKIETYLIFLSLESSHIKHQEIRYFIVLLVKHLLNKKVSIVEFAASIFYQIN